MIFYRLPENHIKGFEPPLKYMRYIKQDRDNILLKADVVENKISPSQFKLSYPIIKSLPSMEAETGINNSIITRIAKLFKYQVLSMEDSEFVDINSSYEILLNDKSLLSLLLKFYTYTYHAAHGYTYFDSLTFDLNSGKIIELSDLFNPGLNFLKALSEIAIKKVKESGVALIADFKGLSEDQKFYLTPDSLVIYYQLYEYTPYAYGRFDIKIPIKEIENLLHPLSPLKKLI